MMRLNSKRPGPNESNEGGRLAASLREQEKLHDKRTDNSPAHVAFQGNYATFFPRRAKPRWPTNLRGFTTKCTKIHTWTEKHQDQRHAKENRRVVIPQRNAVCLM